jgi:hypothetical protein
MGNGPGAGRDDLWYLRRARWLHPKDLKLWEKEIE